MMVLNSELFGRLQMATAIGLPDGIGGGAPVVANAGEPMRATYHRDVMTGRTTMNISEFGESYRICCPFCGDDRHRLYVNHRWGVFDGKTGHRHWTYMTCFNEQCHSDPENRKELRETLERCEKLMDSDHVSFQLPPPIEEAESEGPRIVLMPDGVFPLTDLPPQHPAVQYMMSRGFDHQLASWHHGFSYCVCGGRMPSASERIIAPMYVGESVCGWQARYVGDPPENVPKWLTGQGTKKSRLLYGFNHARQWPFVVLTEGIFDVLAVGDFKGRCFPGPAVAPLGHSLSQAQRKLLIDNWGSGAVFLMFDADVWDKTLQLAEDLKGAFAHGVIPVALPPGKDPADLQHRELWKLISSTAHQHALDLLKFIQNEAA